MLHLSKIWTKYAGGVVVFLAMSANTSFGAPIWNQIEKSTPNDVASDPYIQKFMNRYGGDCVGYSDNKLVLYADPSAGRLVAMIVGVFLLGGCSLVFLDGNSRGDTVPLGIIGLGFSTLLLGRLLYEVSLKNGNLPYITFDQTGLLVYDERRLRWGSIDHMETSIQSSTYGSSHDYGHGSVITMQTVNTEILSLVDEFGATLFSVYANDSFLPISINQFKALVRHYLTMYGKEAKAKN